MPHQLHMLSLSMSLPALQRPLKHMLPHERFPQALAVQQRLRGPKPQLPKPQAAAVDAWWAAAWAHMGGLIRIGRVDAKDVSR